MSQVRETIELLTKILKANGTSKIKAEVFRLAKFDKEDAVPWFRDWFNVVYDDDTAVASLWKLLFELLYFLEHGIIDEVAVRACNELTTEEQVVYVKQKMQQRGFYSRQFAALPNDMSQGSRELLLSFAWLFCSENMVDRFMEKCASPIDDSFPELPEVTVDVLEQASQSLTPVQKVQRVQLLNGKLYHSLKRLYSLQRERTKLQHRVHESTQGTSSAPNRSHLSVLEVHLIRHPDYLKKLLRLLEKDNIRLQHMLQWKVQEEVFWKWMESVLDLKGEEQRQTDKPSNPPMMHYNIPPDLIGRTSTARKKLEAAILKYEPIIEQLEELWEKTHTSISEADLDQLLSIIDSELASHKANISANGTGNQPSTSSNSPGNQPNMSSHSPGKQPSISSGSAGIQPSMPSGSDGNRLPIYREPFFTHVKPSNKKWTNVRQPNQRNVGQAEGAGDSAAADIQSELVRLETHIKRLEMEAGRKERLFRGELDGLATGVPGAICIQPASLSQ